MKQKKETDLLDKAIHSISEWNSGFPVKSSKEFVCGCGCSKE